MNNEDQIDALLALAAEQGTAISENIARQKVLLDTLENLAPQAGEAVKQIAKDTFLRSAAVLDAKTAESTTAAAKRLTEASAAFRWKTITVATLVSVLGVIAIAAATWAATTYQRHELDQLSGQVSTMRQNVADLEKRGGKVQFSTCGDRLCFEVTKKDPGNWSSKETGKNYAIPAGY